MRLEGTRFHEVFGKLSTHGVVTRRLELMPYGLAEFEITDLDGYAICLSQELEDASDLPTPSAQPGTRASIHIDHPAYYRSYFPIEPASRVIESRTHHARGARVAIL